MEQELLTLSEHVDDFQFLVWFVLLNIKLSLYDVVDHCLSLFELRLLISL
jgi:hypothetical protein